MARSLSAPNLGPYSPAFWPTPVLQCAGRPVRPASPLPRALTSQCDQLKKKTTVKKQPRKLAPNKGVHNCSSAPPPKAPIRPSSAPRLQAPPNRTAERAQARKRFSQHVLHADVVPMSENIDFKPNLKRIPPKMEPEEDSKLDPNDPRNAIAARAAASKALSRPSSAPSRRATWPSIAQSNLHNRSTETEYADKGTPRPLLGGLLGDPLV